MTRSTPTSIRRHSSSMTPIEILCSAPCLSAVIPGVRASRGNEIWSAQSLNGQWLYERTEEPGTPWVTTHTPTGHVEYFTSLPKARRWTASDNALAQVRRGLLYVLRTARQYGDQTAIGDQVLTVAELEHEIGRRLTALTVLTVLTA